MAKGLLDLHCALSARLLKLYVPLQVSLKGLQSHTKKSFDAHGLLLVSSNPLLAHREMAKIEYHDRKVIVSKLLLIPKFKNLTIPS